MVLYNILSKNQCLSFLRNVIYPIFWNVNLMIKSYVATFGKLTIVKSVWKFALREQRTTYFSCQYFFRTLAN